MNYLFQSTSFASQKPQSFWKTSNFYKTPWRFAPTWFQVSLGYFQLELDELSTFYESLFPKHPLFAGEKWQNL